jgi:hypothetical protein
MESEYGVRLDVSKTLTKIDLKLKGVSSYICVR